MCGIVGVYNVEEAAAFAREILLQLQHRGQEAVGIATSHEGVVHARRKAGDVRNGFGTPVQLERLVGSAAIGHVRYSTAGKKGNGEANRQPLAWSKTALAVNGKLTNAGSLREKLEGGGALFSTPDSDSEVIAHLVGRSLEDSLEGKFQDALSHVQGAYSLVALWNGNLVVARDPRGYRPLAIGRLREGYIVSSEEVTLRNIKATDIHSVGCGELIVIGEEGLQSYSFPQETQRQHCLMEEIYFSRPDTRAFDPTKETALIRTEHGRRLAKEQPADADIVICVPDSGRYAAQGYATESGIPYVEGFMRNRNAGRSFIEPTQDDRELTVLRKQSPIKGLIEGKRVVVVDDSLVRGTTSRTIVKMLYDAGAAEVHMRIASPPIRYSCFYGLDTPTREELIASDKEVAEIREFIGADSLGYLSLGATQGPVQGDNYCHACFSGRYANNLGDFKGIAIR